MISNRIPSTGAKRSPERKRTFSMPFAALFSPAKESAFSEISEASTSEAGRFLPSASAIAPLPVQRSRIFSLLSLFPAALFSASSTRISVSGRGMSTPLPTLSLSP